MWNKHDKQSVYNVYELKHIHFLCEIHTGIVILTPIDCVWFEECLIFVMWYFQVVLSMH